MISEVRDKCNYTDILHTCNQIEPPGYMKSNIPTNVLYHFVTKEKIDYIEFFIREEDGRSIDFNGDVLVMYFLHYIWLLAE